MQDSLHILGAGSLGLVYAYHLKKAGKSVSLIVKPHKAKKSVVDIHYRHKDFEASTTINNCDAKSLTSIDTLFILTKSYDTESALDEVGHAVHAGTTILLCQNGMGNQSLLTNLYPQNAIYQAVSFEGAKRISSFSVNHTGKNKTVIGALSEKKVPHLQQTLSCALNIEYTDNINPIIWEKLAVNCCINPLTVIFDCLNGELLNFPKALTLIREITTECTKIAQAYNVRFPDGFLYDLCIDMIKATANNSSSMREDVRLQKRTEIDYITGFIIQAGKDKRIATPANDFTLNAFNKAVEIKPSPL